MNKKIIFSTGGTGGHMFPATHLMKHFLDKGYEVLLVTDSRGNSFLKNFNRFKTYVINAKTPTKKNLFEKIISSIFIFYSIIKTAFILKKEKPNLIFGFGGYVSFPISFTSKFFNIPLVIYENNMILGRTNKYLSTFSKKIFLAKKITINFPEKYNNKTYIVGSILNKNIASYLANTKKNNKDFFSILILGGSQGAKIFGEMMPEVIKMLTNNGFKIKVNQQCTKEQKIRISDFYNKNNIENNVFEFNNNILELISTSDLAISRCGASTTAELVHTLTPFIAIPLPDSIDNHQYLNAQYYEKKGCCLILEQEKLNTINLFNLLMETIKNKNKLEDMRLNMKKNYNLDAYKNIENEVESLLKNEN